MLQTSNLAVLLIFFLLFPFLAFTECQVLSLRGVGHVTLSCKRPTTRREDSWSCTDSGNTFRDFLRQGFDVVVFLYQAVLHMLSNTSGVSWYLYYRKKLLE